MDALIDSCVIIQAAKKTFPSSNDADAFKKLFYLSQSTKFSFSLYRSSINLEEVLPADSKYDGKAYNFMMTLFEGIKEVDSRSTLGSSPLGKHPLGGINTGIERKRFIDQFIKASKVGSKSYKNNTNDGRLMYLAYMMGTDYFITTDNRTILLRHKSFIKDHGIKALTPNETYEDLLDIFPEIEYYVEEGKNIFEKSGLNF